MSGFVVKKISKSFGAVKALDEVNFSAEHGEIHAILGENGAGKSTLIKILSGVQQADEGTITLNGKELRFKSPKEALACGIGTVFQELSLMQDLTVAQNIFFEHYPKSKGIIIDKKLLREKALELFQKYDIMDIDPDIRTNQLSLSQQQMVEIIKVISREPSIIILDEATSALTQNRVHWLLDLARKLADKNKMILFISHRLQETRQNCDRVTVLRNGRDVGVRTLNEVDNDELVSLMIGRKLSAYFPEWKPMASEQPQLEAKSLTIDKYLNNVTFTLRKGEVLGVGGLAGQGQVPLFLALAGIRHATGEIMLDGRKIVLRNPGDALENGITLIPEDRSTEGLIQTMSIRINLLLPSLSIFSKWGFLNRKQSERAIEEAIERLEIKMGSSDDMVMSLSGGNQQKVLISKYLMLNPKVFLMLDPTRGVDVGTKSEMFRLVRKLAEEGNSVLFYSTDLSELTGICDRVMVMYDNSVFDTLVGEEITKENILKASVGESIRITQ
ncbi:MAG: sugar ABC transporter ATP-binding protein [Eubacteriales bacterium]|nr:sugar ABC transporter ATP-binding protein [Eubacteriales bacterium]